MTTPSRPASGRRRVVHSSQQLANVRLTPPGGGEPKSLTSASTEDRTSGDTTPAWEIDVPDTRRAGLYRVSWDEGPLGTQQDLFAANPDPRESDLERIAAADLKGMLAPLNVEIAAARGDGNDAFSATGREIWHELAWVLARPADLRVDPGDLGGAIAMKPTSPSHPGGTS